MCGIVAIFNKKNIRNESGYDSVTREMIDSIYHRGKDRESIINYKNISVGFRRLAITEVDSDNLITSKWVVYLNGEIYNYKDFGFSGNECDVISQGLEKFGVGFIEKLNGMFFILAVNNEDVYVFRDRYGIKPIYYWQNSNIIIVSSEIKAIIKHKKYIFHKNKNVVEQWQVFNNCLTNETLFTGIYKFEKGSYWHLNTNTKIKYWEWVFKPKKIEYSEAINKIRTLIINAIEKQKPKEVLYGSCLSGGIDSNIIAALLPNDIHTFTVGFSEGVNEQSLAKIIGNSKKHHEIYFDKINYLEETIYHLEDLRVGASWANFGMYKEAARFIKVLFDGAGADELFGGYTWRYEKENYYDIVNRTNKESVLCKYLFDHIFPYDTLEKRFEFDANHFLEGVLLVGDKLSMAHTIEVRFPFLDNDLVDFCLTLPNEYKQNKQILRDAFKHLLPYRIIKNKKQGFSSPDWFLGKGNQANKWAENSLNIWDKIYNKKNG